MYWPYQRFNQKVVDDYKVQSMFHFCIILATNGYDVLPRLYYFIDGDLSRKLYQIKNIKPYTKKCGLLDKPKDKLNFRTEKNNC